MSAPLPGVWYPHVLNETASGSAGRFGGGAFSSSTRWWFGPPNKGLPTLGNGDVNIGLRDATDTAAATSEVRSEIFAVREGESRYRRRRAITITMLGVAALVIAFALVSGAEGVAAGALVVVGVWLARYRRGHSR